MVGDNCGLKKQLERLKVTNNFFINHPVLVGQEKISKAYFFR